MKYQPSDIGNIVASGPGWAEILVEIDCVNKTSRTAWFEVAVAEEAAKAEGE